MIHPAKPQDFSDAPHPAPSATLTPGFYGFLFALCLLLAFLIRWLPSLRPMYWYDEIFTVAISRFSHAGIVARTARDVHPPLYYFLVHDLMRIGGWLGGAFQTLAWLRWASLAPGILTCLLAWWGARRLWGRSASLVVLLLFALSPGLAFYSVELRNYALTNMALLGSTLCLIEVARNPRGSSWFAVAGYVAFISAALYSHNIATIYIAAQGLLLLFELLFISRSKGFLALKALVALALTLAIYSFWIPKLLEQNAYLNKQELPWMAPTRLRDLFSSFFFFFPFGPTEWLSPWRGFARILMFGAAMASAGLVTVASFSILFAANDKKKEHPADIDRLLLYSVLLTIIPLGITFLVSWKGWARIFMPTRYNFLAAPFWTLALAGFLLRLRPPLLRSGAIVLVAIVSAVSVISLQGQRAFHRQDFECLENLPKERAVPPDGRLYLSNTEVLPWLARSGDYHLRAPETALADADRTSVPVWFVCHQVTSSGSLADGTSLLLEKLIEKEPSAAKIELKPECWDWGHFYKVSPDGLRSLAKTFRRLNDERLARIASVPGGQVLLPGDLCFQEGEGWDVPEYTDSLQLFCWTDGDHQIVKWPGPETPGRYQLKAYFWRPNPYPTPEVELKYRLPGETQWRSMAEPMGNVTVEGTIRTQWPRQPLRLELKIPGWVPSELIPGSKDSRRLGIQFGSIELRPFSDGSNASP